LELSPEERRRIYEEEKARLEAERTSGDSVERLVEEHKRSIREAETQPIKSKRKLGCWTWCFIIVGGLWLIGTMAGHQPPASTTTSTAPPAEPSRDALEVIEYHKSFDEEYGSVVVGTVKNNTDKQYSYVQVEVNLYDASGNQVGSTMANVNNLEPFGTWKFKAPISQGRIAQNFRIKDVSGW